MTKTTITADDIEVAERLLGVAYTVVTPEVALAEEGPLLNLGQALKRELAVTADRPPSPADIPIESI